MRLKKNGMLKNIPFLRLKKGNVSIPLLLFIIHLHDKLRLHCIHQSHFSLIFPLHRGEIHPTNIEIIPIHCSPKIEFHPYLIIFTPKIALLAPMGWCINHFFGMARSAYYVCTTKVRKHIPTDSKI